MLRPLPTHNMYPAMLRNYDPVPSSALDPYRHEIRFGLFQHYTSAYTYDELPDGRLLADMEIYTLEFKMDKSITSNTELGLTLPIHYAWDGFLDDFLRTYHDTLGIPNSGREFRPDNEYAWTYKNADGSEAWDDKAGWEFGNAETRLRHQLITYDRYGLSLLAALKLPTGSKSRGWSSGYLDAAVGLVYSWKGSPWFGHIEGWAIYPFSSDESEFNYRSYARGLVTLGWMWNARLSLLGQLQGGSSVYDTDLSQLDGSPFQLSLGLNWLFTENSMINFSFVENISQQTTPDFTITVGQNFE